VSDLGCSYTLHTHINTEFDLSRDINRHQLNKTERKSAEQLQILSEHNSSTAEQDNFEAQVELGNKEARLTALEVRSHTIPARHRFSASPFRCIVLCRRPKNLH